MIIHISKIYIYIDIILYGKKYSLYYLAKNLVVLSYYYYMLVTLIMRYYKFQ